MRIETCFVRPELDGRGRGPSERLSLALSRRASAEIVDVVLTDIELTRAFSEEIFADPAAQFVVDGLAPDLRRGWDWLIEIAYRPGVTDTLASTAREALTLALGGPEALEGRLVQTARLLLVSAPGTAAAEIERAASSLWNPLVQTATFVSYSDWSAGMRLPELYPPVSIHDPVEPALIDLVALDDAGLERLSAERLLALSIDEMRAVRAYFSDPANASARAVRGLAPQATDVELEMIAQTWSEHCKHKIFNADIAYSEDGGPSRLVSSLFKTCIRSTTEELAPGRPDLLSVFTDNAGVFRFDGETAVCVKAETHNSPSALDPYGGAMT
ncbi:MAG: hypothetical protein Q8M76_00555, partial [Spirochaetaceae bacterium]|nr:hypothetical protein [Spirochaetaceae bacterium]